MGPKQIFIQTSEKNYQNNFQGKALLCENAILLQIYSCKVGGEGGAARGGRWGAVKGTQK